MATALIAVACVLLVALAWWRLAIAVRTLNQIRADLRSDTPTDPETTTQP